MPSTGAILAETAIIPMKCLLTTSCAYALEYGSQLMPYNPEVLRLITKE